MFNEEQQKAIETIKGQLILVACPGSGKTTTLLGRIHEMIQQGVPAENILMVTFTTAAAGEMKQRFWKKYAEDGMVTFCTIHSFCLATLKKFAHFDAECVLATGDIYEFFFQQLVRHKEIVDKDYLQEVDGQNCIIHPQKYLTAEKRIAKNIRRLASASCENQSFSPDLILYAARACKMNYGEQQRSAFPMVLRKKGVKILTGGPGTGKTTTILGILLAYKRMHPKDTIRLCAPTGRAAQRMAESTHMEAVTVHRLLDLKPYGDTTVCKDSSDPIDADLIVVDEMSMINIEVFDLLLEAIKTGTTLVLVGDINQLESVGAGAVLHDLLEAPESLIPRTMLTDVFRQKGDSSIISNAIRINAGITTLDERPDFQVIHTKSAEESLEQVKSLMKKLYNPEEPFSTQILCPARKGISGVENMNIALQALLNPQTKGITYGSIKYRLNDKVMFYKNNYSISSYEGEIGLYNGDIGKIVKVSESGLTVNVRNSHYEITRDLMDNLGLSYAMTIHKSQGSEFSCIIVVMPAEPTNMLVRNLFYTAVTRAKKKVYVIDESYAMETSIRIAKAGKRLTNLAEYLKSE